MRIIQLKDLASVDISNIDKKSKDGEKEVALCNFVDVYHNWAITEELASSFMKATANAKQIERFRLHKGQVAITKDSETRDDIGIPTYIADDITDGVLGYHCALITPDESLLKGAYLNIVLHSPYAKKYFEMNASGSGQRYTLTNEIIGGLPVPMPDDIIIQEKLGELCSNIDQKTSNNTSICSVLESMAKTLYDYWFVQFDFPDENGKPYKSSGGKMVWNEELKREIPEGWEVGCFKDVLEIGNGKDHKALAEGDIPVYGSGGFMRTVNSSLYEGESVLIPRKGTLNNIMYVNEAFWTVDTMFYTKMKRAHSAKYMYYSAKIYDFERLNTGTGVPSMTADIVYKLKVVIPSESLLKRFDQAITPWYQMISERKKENQQLAEIRDFLLPMLINGQVKVEKESA